MRILRAETYRRMRWKNGGGDTAEIAVSPEDARLGDFDWRVSMATVESSGPFSMFAGVDRTLSILEGEGMVLEIEAMAPMTLTTASAPFSFPADTGTNAGLIGGPVTDLNVMTRRGRYRHAVVAHRGEGEMELELNGAPGLLFCRSGEMLVSHRGRSEKLGRFDTLTVDRGGALRIDGSAQFFVIELNEI